VQAALEELQVLRLVVDDQDAGAFRLDCFGQADLLL
jgi:hypothetical protein